MDVTTIRDERLRRGWKLADLAQATGLSISHLSGVETGKGCTDATLRTICEALGLRVAIVRDEGPGDA